MLPDWLLLELPLFMELPLLLLPDWLLAQQAPDNCADWLSASLSPPERVEPLLELLIADWLSASLSPLFELLDLLLSDRSLLEELMELL